MPMHDPVGNRYALTNYYWAHQPIPEHIAAVTLSEGQQPG
jgi:hypothetical protein